jgi:endoglucanase
MQRPDGRPRWLAGLLAAASLALIVSVVAVRITRTHSAPKAVQSSMSSAVIGGNTTYTVKGNQIVNSDGVPVIVHGVNRSSLENSCTGATVTGRETGIPASDFTTIHQTWGATVVRLPVDQDFWLTNCRGYIATVKRAVREITANHMIAILDLHWWTRKTNLTFATTAEAMCMPDRSSVTFWRQVATTYRSDPDVWFELYNEPNPPGSTSAAQWNTWRFGGMIDCENDLTDQSMGGFRAIGMQQLVNTIRDADALNIILADGLDKAFTLAGVPTLSGTNIAYAIHPYLNNPTVNTASGWSISEWDTRFGNLASHVPVVATEFGDFECGDTAYARTYDQAILSYFRTHQMSYLAWDWVAEYGCSVPQLIANANGTCRGGMGCLIQQAMLSYQPPSATDATLTPGQRSDIQRSRLTECAQQHAITRPGPTCHKWRGAAHN